MCQVKCNNCDWNGHEDDLSLVEFDKNDESETATAYDTGSGTPSTRLSEVPIEIDFLKGCPNCLTDSFLMDI